MSELVLVDLNDFIKSDSVLTAIAGAALDVVPFNTKEPCDATGAPLGKAFIRYMWMPGVYSLDKYFIRRDRVRYYVMDRDFERLFRLTNRFIYLFNQEHAGEMIIPCTGSKNRVMNVWVSNSSSNNPNEKGGLGQQMVEVEVRYVPTTSNSHYGGT